MKRFYKKVFKSDKPALGSIQEPGPATSISTFVTNTTDPMPSIHGTSSDATASAQVTSGVSLSV